MKNSCENFILLLQDYPETAIDKESQEHLAVCENCRKLLENHNQSFDLLKSQLTLSPQKKQQIFARIHQTIAAEKTQESNTPFSTFLAWLFAHRLQLVLPVVILAFGIMFFSQNNPDSKIQISGSAVILRNMEKIELDQKSLQLALGEKISLLKGRLNLFWNEIETVAIDGRLDFSAADMSIKAQSGEAVMNFTPSAKGYLIETRRSLLKIVGTTIKLELTDNSDVIFVEKGKIEWALHDNSRKGEAAAGIRILIRADNRGSLTVEESPFAQMNSADGAIASQSPDPGVKLIKSGKDWVFQEIEPSGAEKKQ
ncbi:MAG: hypothetical protein KKB51_19480 [Candidatus Riflebacteria bacterium]|nr:hypothetical protein [Candidatus Riflebacteria bacterium]